MVNVSIQLILSHYYYVPMFLTVHVISQVFVGVSIYLVD